MSDARKKFQISNYLKDALTALQQDSVNNEQPVGNCDAANALCYAIEASLLHHLKGSSANFWSVLRKYTHASMLKQIHHLSQITTDVGRCRSWIRIAINDGALESYLHLIISDSANLRYYYRSTAFLRDAEQPDIMLTYLQGLAELTFNLSFNSTVLNQWTSTTLVLAGLLPNLDVLRPVASASRNNSQSARLQPTAADEKTVSSQIFVARYIFHAVELLFSADGYHGLRAGPTVATRLQQLQQQLAISVVAEQLGTGASATNSAAQKNTTTDDVKDSGDLSVETNSQMQFDDFASTLTDSFSDRLETTSPGTPTSLLSHPDLYDLRPDIYRFAYNTTPLSITMLSEESNRDESSIFTAEPEPIIATSTDEPLQLGFNTTEQPSVVDPIESSTATVAVAVADEQFEAIAATPKNETVEVQICSDDNRTLLAESSCNIVSETAVDSQDSVCYDVNETNDFERSEAMQLEADSVAASVKQLASDVRTLSSRAQQNYKDVSSSFEVMSTQQSTVEEAHLPATTAQQTESQRVAPAVAILPASTAEPTTTPDKHKTLTDDNKQPTDDDDDDNCDFGRWQDMTAGHYTSAAKVCNATEKLAICTEKGLSKQCYQCHGCMRPIGMFYGKERLCNYDGFYYCCDCHENQQHCIPARVVCNWDFRPYSVSNRNFQVLSQLVHKPLIHLDKFNLQLYDHVSDLRAVQLLREQLFYLKAYAYSCRLLNVNDVINQLGGKAYLLDDMHTYSLTDLQHVMSGSLSRLLKKAVNFGIEHVYQCILCSQKGFICEICQNPKVIYPFELDSTSKCLQCYAVYHVKCKTALVQCPRCIRRNRNSATSPTSICNLPEHQSTT